MPKVATVIRMVYNVEKIQRKMEMYQIRRANKEDLPQIQSVYSFARAFMARTGNPHQWGSTHPPLRQLEEDVRLGNLYVAEDSAGIHGVFAFILGEDPTYTRIEDGAWHSVRPYGTIHRIASDGSGGVFSAALCFCRSQMQHIRIDTHHDNKVMQHVIEKHGFQRCGIIYIADGNPRIAYDLI